MMQAAQHSLLPHDALPQQGEQQIMAQQLQARVQAPPGTVDLTPIRERVGRTDRLSTGRLPLLSRLLRRLHPGAFLSWSASAELLYAQRRRTGAATALTDAGFAAPFADATVAPARVVTPPAAHSTPPPVTVARKPGRTLGQPVVGDSPVPVAPQAVVAPLPSAHLPQQAAVTPSRGGTVHSAPVALPSVTAAAPDLPLLARALAASAEARVTASPMLRRPAAENNPTPPDHVPASTAVSRSAGQASRVDPSSTPAYTGNLGAAIVQRHLRHMDSHAVGSSQATMTVASLALAPQPSTAPAAHAQPVTALPVNAPRVGTSDSAAAQPLAQVLPTAAPVKITAGTMASHPPGEQPIVDSGLGLAVQRAAERSIDHAHRENEAQPATVEQTGSPPRWRASAALPPSTPSVALSLHRSPSAGRDDTPLGAASVAGAQRASALAPRLLTEKQIANRTVAPSSIQSFPPGGDAAGRTALPKQTVATEPSAAQVKSEGESPLLLRQPTRSPLPAVPPMAEVKRQSAPSEQPGLPMIGRSAPAGQVLTQRIQQASTHQSKPGQSGPAPQADGPLAQSAYPSPPTVGAAPVAMRPPVAVAGPGAALIMARRTGKFGAPIVQRRLHERTTLNSSIAGPPRTDPPHATVAPVIAQPVASTRATPLPLLAPSAVMQGAAAVQQVHAVAGDAPAGTSVCAGVEQHSLAQTAARVTPTMTAPAVTASTESASTVNEPFVQPKAANPAVALIWPREQRPSVAAEPDAPLLVPQDRPVLPTVSRSLSAARTAEPGATPQQESPQSAEPDVTALQRHNQESIQPVAAHRVLITTATIQPAPAPVWRTVPMAQRPWRGGATTRQPVADVVGEQPDYAAGARDTFAPAHRQRQGEATGGISHSVVVEQPAPVKAADDSSSFAEVATVQTRDRTNDAPAAAPSLSPRADRALAHAAQQTISARTAVATAPPPVSGARLPLPIARSTATTAAAKQPGMSVPLPVMAHDMRWPRRLLASAELPSSTATPVMVAYQPTAQTTSSLAAQEMQGAATSQRNPAADLLLALPPPISTLRRSQLADESSNVLSAKILRRYLAYPAAQGLAAQGSSESAADAYEPLPVALTVGGYPPNTAAALGQLSASLERWPGANGDSSITAGCAAQDGSLSQGQQPAASLPLLLQRAAREATAGESPPLSSAVTASPSSAAMSTTEIVRAGQEEDELERLADRVYALIEQRLIIERESMGM